ncbi:MAG: hypothetical protein IJR38_02625 [Selenomonadaceae bacterium]|nr:hypothetical protein [Selenomonadaceae bacterium]
MGAKLLKSEIVTVDNLSSVTGKYYWKFYNKMVAMFTRPGLISLDEVDIAPFKSFNGAVYMGEAVAMGENAAAFAAKEAVSKAKSKKIAKSKNILVHILGSTGKVDTSTDAEAVSSLREIAPNAEIILGAHLDEKLGDALRVTVFVRLHYDGERFDEYTEKLYRLLRETPKDKLPGLNNCPEYQDLYDSARENDDDDWCWFSETMDVVAYDLSMEEYNPRRFIPRPDMEDMPELIMKEILTGKRPAQT